MGLPKKDTKYKEDKLGREKGSAGVGEDKSG